MAAKEKRAGNRQADCQRTTEIKITLPALVKTGALFYVAFPLLWTPCISFTKKWWDSKCSGGTRVLFSSKSQRAMAVTHRISPSSRRPTVLLEAKSEQLNSDRSTLHHIALNVSLEDFESEKMRLEGLGLKVDATTHEWFHVWRHGATVLPHPERCPEPVEGGNLLEFACYDASVG